jgi:hypothetical protein
MRAAAGEIAGALTSSGPAVVTLTPADFAAVGEELAAYHARFAWAVCPARAAGLGHGIPARAAHGRRAAQECRSDDAPPPGCRAARRAPRSPRCSSSSARARGMTPRSWRSTNGWSPSRLASTTPSSSWMAAMCPSGGSTRRGSPRSGVGPRARPTTAKPASSWPMPAGRATRCSTGGSSCPRRGSTRTMRHAGGRVASRPWASL